MLQSLSPILRRSVTVIVVALLPINAVAAQTITRRDSSGTPPLFTWRDAALAGGFLGLTLGMFPLDRPAAQEIREPDSQDNRLYKNGSRLIQSAGDPGALAFSLGLYGLGRIAKRPTITDVGLHTTEAVVLAGATTALLKGVVGRARPNVVGDSVAGSFSFGRGFGKNGYSSFPSGHTTVAFAAAAALTSESQHFWPHHEWLVGSALYGGAALVGLSRMYNNAHWASDVTLGAAIGTFSGIKVVRYSHDHPNNFLDRVLRGAEVTPTSNRGFGIGWHLTR